jgi:hypothetical protein
VPSPSTSCQARLIEGNRLRIGPRLDVATLAAIARA